MSTSEQATALRYALLASGAIPEQSAAMIDPTVLPAAGSGGYSVVGALQALIQASLREDGTARRARIEVTTVDLSATYTLAFGAASTAYVAAVANLTALIAAWSASINADVTVNDIVTAQPDPDDATILLIIWGADATGIDWSGTGTAAVTITTEYESGSVFLMERALVRTQSTPAAAAWGSWQLMTLPSGFDGSYSLANGFGVRCMIPCPGRAAMFVYLANLAGHVDDGVTGTPADLTLLYATPRGIVAPVVAS
jgi:hypothetical protein